MKHRGLPPLVAVSGADQQASWGAWNDRATIVPSAYPAAVKAAGGCPVVVAPTAEPEVVAERADALLLSGGVDLGSDLYGAEPHPQTQVPDPERDAFEAALLDACCSRGIPVLAICRGLQVLNVARGGTLHQHLPETVGNTDHLPTPGAFGRHEVRVATESRLFKILGRDRASVPTHHHQAVDRIGTGLVPTAWADDGIVEAVEDSSEGFLVAVQWHPEAGEDLSLFLALVQATAGPRERGL